MITMIILLVHVGKSAHALLLYGKHPHLLCSLRAALESNVLASYIPPSTYPCLGVIIHVCSFC